MNTKWEEKRAENCIPADDGRKRKYEKVDLNTYRNEEDFAEFYDEGEILPVPDFLASKGYDPSTIGAEDMQIRFIEQAWDAKSTQLLPRMRCYRATMPIPGPMTFPEILFPKPSFLGFVTVCSARALALCQDLGLQVTQDKGISVVVIMDGKRKVKLGARHAAGKTRVLSSVQSKFNHRCQRRCLQTLDYTD